jgi:hypothetical protein
MVPVLVEILALVQRQVLDQRLAIDPLAVLAGAADGFVALLAGGVDHIERHPGHVGDHDGAVGGLALDLGRAGIGVALGAVIACRQQAGLQIGDHIAVLGMDERQGAQFGAALERGEHLVVVDHQGALVGHEMLEGVDALLLHHLLHLVEDLLAPPGDGHVVGVIATGTAGLVVPHPQRIDQALIGCGQREVDHHGGSARERGAGAGLEIIGRVGAHEGHLQMGMRIDAAGHDIAAGGVELGVADEVGADGGDLAALDQHVGLVGQVGGDDGAVFDGCGHG